MTSIAGSNGTHAAMSTAGWTSVQGGRPYNEDAHLSDAEFLPTRSSCFQLHGVFDGHGGASVAEFCVERLPVTLRGILQSRLDADALDRPRNQAVSVVKSALEEAVMDMNPQLQSADSKKFLWMGSTAVVCLMYKQHVWVANTGDSRAVCGRTTGATSLTQDHKASCPDELQRITEAGGQVINNGGPRLMGVLAVTRAIGDLALRNYGLTARPDTFHFERSDQDEFLILASDGLWDVISNQEAVQLVRRVFQKTGDSSAAGDAPRVASSVLTQVALRKQSRDNITALVIDLRPPHRRTPSRPCLVSTRMPELNTYDEPESALEAQSAIAALMAAPKPSRSHPEPTPSLRIPSRRGRVAHEASMDMDLPSLHQPQLLDAAALTDPSQFHAFLTAPAGYTDDLATQMLVLQQQQQPDDMAVLYQYTWPPADVALPAEYAGLAAYQHQPMDDLAPLLLGQQQQLEAAQLGQPGKPLLLTTAVPSHRHHHQHHQQHPHQEPSLRVGPSLHAAGPAAGALDTESSGSRAQLRLQQLQDHGMVSSPGKRRRAPDEVDVTSCDAEATVLPVLLYNAAPEVYTHAYVLQSGAVRAC